MLKNLRDKVADTLLNLLFLSVVNGVSYQDIINVAHCLEVELHHCGSIHPPFNGIFIRFVHFIQVTNDG